MKQMFNHLRSKMHPKLETFKIPIFHGFHPQHNTISALEKTHILGGFNQLGLSFKVLVKFKARLLLPSPRSNYKSFTYPLTPTPHVRTGGKYQLLSGRTGIPSQKPGNSSPKPPLIYKGNRAGILWQGWICTAVILLNEWILFILLTVPLCSDR